MGLLKRQISQGVDLLRRGVLKTVADRYAEYLKARRLAPRTIVSYLHAIAHFAQWLWTARGQAALPVREEDVSVFLSAHRGNSRCSSREPYSRRIGRAALHHLVQVLREDGVYMETPRALPTAVDQEIAHFNTHLVEVCGAAAQTRLHRTRHVKEFLTFVFGDGPVQHEKIRPEHFGRFITARARRCSPGTAGVITSGLRSYIRFLEFQGLCASGLRDAVPRVARWRLASIPVHLQGGELERFLLSFDRRSARGRRDYAMALCLAVLGLRAGEVAALQLDGIDWRGGTLTIPPGKTRRGRSLPLPPRVGSAIVAFLRVRPRSASGALFLRIGYLHGEPFGPSVVRSAVRLGYKRAGLSPSYTGTHLLRHTAATNLVSSGASIKEVADVLGHASLDSTALYAKVDLVRLRGVALPWTEVVG